MFVIIDAHTHYFPEELHADPRAWGEVRGERHWADLVAPRNRPSLQGWATQTRMLADMDAAGIEVAVLAGWYWEHGATCRWHNRKMAGLLQSHPERFAALATCQPLDGPVAVIEELEFARQAGFRGVGELLPALQGYSYDHPGFLACLEFCRSHHWPILLHITEPVGRSHIGRIETPLQPLVDFLAGHRENRFVLAHWGGLLPFFELNPYIHEQLVHVSYDTAASPLLYDPAVFSLAVQAIGPERILFGSDYPLLNFPGIEKTPGFQRSFNQARDTLPDSKHQEALLGGNAARCFGITPH